jgi:ABC-type multidrug transport system ATPase subunit
MKISLTDAGKRFNREWIFRHVNLDLTTGNRYAITGSNGSGKSTLLQAIAGMLQLSEGTLAYEGIADNMVYSAVAFSAPYSDVIEEMTLVEFLDFHNGFKKFIRPGTDIIHEIGLGYASQKQIRYYSSGMKQRVRLAQAVFADTPVLLLDEPTSNFDEEGIRLYLHLIQQYSKDRVTVICSNDPKEYEFCDHRVRMEDYKGVRQGIAKGHT